MGLKGNRGTVPGGRKELLDKGLSFSKGPQTKDPASGPSEEWALACEDGRETQGLVQKHCVPCTLSTSGGPGCLPLTTQEAPYRAFMALTAPCRKIPAMLPKNTGETNSEKQRN